MIRTAMFLATVLVAGPALAQHDHASMQGATKAMPATAAGPMVHADAIDATGKSVGMVMAQDTPHGVLVTTDVKGLPAGEHGFHFHEKGTCDAKQKFTTAGAHFAAGKPQHGLMVAAGPHGGDMPNAIVGADGSFKSQLLNTGVTLKAGPKSLADADGSALVIHAKADDYKTQPSGDAGDRIVCAVVSAPKK
jgi:Cu-Zn family superoxide dismutase